MAVTTSTTTTTHSNRLTMYRHMVHQPFARRVAVGPAESRPHHRPLPLGQETVFLLFTAMSVKDR